MPSTGADRCQQGLCDGRNVGRGCSHVDGGRHNSAVGRGGRGRRGSNNNVAVSGSLLRTVARDVSSLAAPVAGLASSVEGTAVGSGAVTRDVTKLAASIALHGLGLAVSCKVVRPTALVASSGTSTASETATSWKPTGIASTAGRRSTRDTCTGGSRTGASQVTRLAAVVATTAGAGATQTQSRAVSLDVTKALTVIALLGLSGAR